MATVILPELPTLFGIFWKGVKIIHFSSEIIFGQLLSRFGDFLLVTCLDLSDIGSLGLILWNIELYLRNILSDDILT